MTLNGLHIQISACKSGVNREPKATKVPAKHSSGGGAFNAIPRQFLVANLVIKSIIISSLLVVVYMYYAVFLILCICSTTTTTSIYHHDLTR